MASPQITAPVDPALDELCRDLSARAAQLDKRPAWPEEQLRLCGEYGVFRWFLETGWGGQGWRDEDLVRGYLKLSAACLTTTFIITQRTGACRRIAESDNARLKAELLPPLARGATFATVGISHLTTSRRHLKRPVLTAKSVEDGYLLSGYSPWVTGGAHADVVVVGATLMDGNEPTELELVAAVPTSLPGIRAPEPADLVGLTASRTGPVEFDRAFVSIDQLIAGPVQNVMQQGVGAATGGHETSTLAVGLASAAIAFLAQEAKERDNLIGPRRALEREHAAVEADLLSIAQGRQTCSKEQLRQRANSLVLRATQAALSAAKGSGYVVGHPAGRWCREALFFLVWSCPQPVAHANLCELAGISQ
jgi:alkylation response protein AidB-like acyl-CoA dehydrogenase